MSEILGSAMKQLASEISEAEGIWDACTDALVELEAAADNAATELALADWHAGRVAGERLRAALAEIERQASLR